MTLPVWERSAPPGTRTLAQIMADVEARAAADKVETEQKAAWPDPEMRATPIVDLPRGPRTIANRCTRWKATMARGPVAAQNENGWRMATSIVLKGEGAPGRLFVAAWTEQNNGDMKLDFIHAHGVGQLSADALKDYLTGGTTS